MRTMDEVHLWLGLDKTTVVFEPSDLPREIIKICVINHHIFALTRNNAVYHSTFECSFEKTLVFKNTNISAIDIACNNEILFFVNDCGQVFKTTPEDLNSRQEIVLEELSKCCSHGYRTSGQRVKVKAIAAERCSCFYITENGQLWVSGDQPKLGLKNEIPQKVTFFEKHCVISVACGDNFSIALAYKPGHCIPEKDDSDTDDEKDGEVFISNCPLCMSSPTSQHSTSETCPLGLPITNASDDRYSTSTTSKDNSAEDKKSTDDSSSGLSDCKADRKKNSEELKDHENADKNDVSRNSQNSSNSVEVSGTSTSKADENDNGNEEEKEEKKNEFFINTEAARQFLTRQLSWVSSYGSAGDDFVECAEASFVRPSQIIRQNVSNVANMVYEGVKTVGDRGVTLLRHMSGGSEASGVLVGCESFEELSAEDFIVPASSITSSLSGGTSDRYEESEVGVTERVAAMVRVGARLLATELWSWGDVNHGQLGTGDTVKRNKPTIIARLTGIGIHQIACGHDHALALSLDGRVFAWGKNNYCQVSVKVNTDQSSPQPISLPTERAKRIAAGDNFSLIAAHDDCIYYMGKGCNKAITKLEIPSLLENTSTQKEIFSTRHISGCLNTSVPTSAAMRDLVVEQNFLEETLLVQNTLIKPLQKKGGLVQETNVYDILCTYHTDIMNVTCLYVRSLQDYSYQKVDECGITVIQNVDEFVRTYRCYLGAVCDVIALSGFAHIARLVDIPQNMYTLFHHEYVKKKKENQEAVVFSAILNPLKRLKSYRGTIQKLITWNESRCANEDQKLAFGTKLKDALTKWEQLCEEQEQRICEADATRKFWESSGRVVELLRSPERRLIRESRSHPLSVINSGRFSSHWFLLFTDVLVHMIGGNHTVHQLPTLWVDVVQDTDSMQNALQLTMPEETLVLYTPTAHDRLEWLHCLQGAVKKSLDKQNSHPPPAVRNAKYTFTKHSVYKDAKYSGACLPI
ncbi:hypothetical protein C0J52_08953 [Blattella germanica]|nr:hypothetical protein C0J52_08953 [Blattella germanica]